MLIAGDIGGTKTDLAIFSSEAGPHVPFAETKFHSADYPHLQAIVKEFLAREKKPVDRACFAIAGPVINGRVKATNLPWLIEEISLAEQLNIVSPFTSSTTSKPSHTLFRSCGPATSKQSVPASLWPKARSRLSLPAPVWASLS